MESGAVSRWTKQQNNVTGIMLTHAHRWPSNKHKAHNLWPSCERADITAPLRGRRTRLPEKTETN